MKLTDIKFWKFLIPIIIISCSNGAKSVNTGSNGLPAQTIFSVEKISAEEFAQAESTSAEYNIYPQEIDSIALQDILTVVFKDVRERIANMDSDLRNTIYEIVTDEEIYCMDNLVYYPQLNLLGVLIPLDPHTSDVRWYNVQTGKNIDTETLGVPTAFNKNGLYVCQITGDCDNFIDLAFYGVEETHIYMLQQYKNLNFNGKQCLFEEDGRESIFWHDNNVLYLRSEDYKDNSAAYLRISLN